jgi:hypothetical protein
MHTYVSMFVLKFLRLIITSAVGDHSVTLLLTRLMILLASTAFPFWPTAQTFPLLTSIGDIVAACGPNLECWCLHRCTVYLGHTWCLGIQHATLCTVVTSGHVNTHPDHHLLLWPSPHGRAGEGTARVGWISPRSAADGIIQTS